MPISNETTPSPVRLTVLAYQTGTDAIVSFDVPPPIPAGMTISETAVRAIYQKLVNAIEVSPDFYDVTATLVTEHRATVTPDAS